MGVYEVAHVDIVANAGPVRRGIIGAENLFLRKVIEVSISS